VAVGLLAKTQSTHRIPQALHSLTGLSEPSGFHPFLHIGVSCSHDERARGEREGASGES